MEHMEYGRNAAYVILDQAGKVVADNNRKGFDEAAKQQLSAHTRACTGDSAEPKAATGKLAEVYGKWRVSAKCRDL